MMNKMKKAVFLIGTFLICFLLPVNAGSLFVGTKVIYPGGANQPPKEKDTGTSLKASARGNFPEKSLTDNLNKLLDDEDYDTLLQMAKASDNKESRVYEAIALFHLDRKKEALSLAKKLLKDKTLPEDYCTKLCEELEIDEQEEQEKTESENF